IFDGTYDDYLEMEQFHYFDNSSEEVNKDFSAKYYILIYREQLVGVIVLKKPYPSNQDDAEFIHLNNNILILDRIILHPLVRGLGVTKYFLHEVIFKQQIKNIFVTSALAEFIPFFEKSDFKKIDKNDYHLTD
ncbi:TPA: hypothetical protein ACF1RY_002974, partial [Enterococcus hirae]